MTNRIDDIEVLRAFAVLLVIVEHMNINLFHWSTPALSRLYTYFGGWTGVDLFFAISGFVIARNLLPKILENDHRGVFFTRVTEFWIRRFWRLIPSAWLWLLLITFATLFFNESGVWGSSRNNFETVVSAFLNVTNLHVAMVYGREFPGAAFVYWSLSLEEQFYMVLPFIILFSKRWLHWVLAAIVVFQLFLVRDNLYAALLRTDALFLGVLIALWKSKASYRLFEPRFLEKPLAALVCYGILLGALATIGSDKLSIIHQKFGLIAILSALLVLSASYDRDYFFGNTWFKPVFLWVGSRSYALYLTHMPSYFLTREIWFRIEPVGTRFGPDYGVEFLLSALFLMAVLSEMNYRFLETPLRKKGARIAESFRASHNSGRTLPGCPD